jgi:hypothetical protein
MPDSLILVDFMALIISYGDQFMDILIFQFPLASGHLLLLGPNMLLRKLH